MFYSAQCNYLRGLIVAVVFVVVLDINMFENKEIDGDWGVGAK